MKTVILISLLMAFAVQQKTSCQETKTISDFKGIEVSGRILMQIERKPEYSLKIDLKAIDTACFSKQIENGILKLQLKSGFKCKGEANIVLTCPELTSITATGKADISTANVLTGDSLHLEVRGNARAYLDMDIKYLEANLSGGGMFNGEGYAITQTIKTSTSSVFSGFTLEGEKLNVECLSNSIAKVYTSGELHAKAGSGGHVIYKGNPEKEKLDPMSNGKIEKSKED